MKLLSDYEYVHCNFSLAGNAKIVVLGSYVINDDAENEFRFTAYLEPLTAIASGKIEAGGYVIFDNSISYRLFERINIYPNE